MLLHLGESGLQDGVHDETMRGLQSAIQVHRGDNGLQRVSQQRALRAPPTAVLAFAEAQKTANLERPRRAQQMARAYDVGPQLGQSSFMIFGETAIKFL